MHLHHVADASALAELIRHYALDVDAPRIAAVLLAASFTLEPDPAHARYH